MNPLSKEFLESRGFCCTAKCKNCPYDPKWSGSSKLKKTKTHSQKINNLKKL